MEWVDITVVPEGWMTDGPETLITEVPLWVPPPTSASSLAVRGRTVSRLSFKDVVGFFIA